MLREAESWDEHRWGIGHLGLLQQQGAIRATYHLFHRKFRWLDRLPYLLVRLAEPGIARRCLEQFDSCSVEEHHRASIKFLGEQSQLRGDILQIAPDGSAISHRLSAAIDGLKGIPFDDSIAEGPHARVLRLARHSRRACWPWLASSVRMKENLQVAREMIPSVNEDLVSLWCNYKSIVQLRRGRRGARGKKISRATFFDYIYKMSFCHEDMDSPEAPGESGD